MGCFLASPSLKQRSCAVGGILCAPARHITDSNFKQPRSPLSRRLRVRGVSSPPQIDEGWQRAVRRKGWFRSRSAPPERRQAATAQRLTARHRGDFCPRDRSSGQRRRAPHSADPDGFPPFTNATSSQHEWQTPVVGPDGDPRPPECVRERLPPARRRRIPVPPQDASRSAPREPDNSDNNPSRNIVNTCEDQ